MLQLIKNYKMLSAVGLSTVLLISCANMGQGPQGGPYDFDAPVLIKASPKQNQTNFKGNKIELVFDENIVVKEANDRIIVTPPQKRMPIVKSANRKLTVELRDTLKENTTYTVDFTDAIRDNNQDNPLENFSISFSTGDVVDSLTISGRVIQAEDIEPVKGYFVGLHSNLEDSAFLKVPFERISKTNDKGEFTIRGVAPGKYHIFALDDKNRDYIYDNPLEAVAFYDVILEPMAEAAVRTDTIFADEEKKLVDSIKTVNYTRFLPDNIVMKSFTSKERKEYFRNAERVVANKMTLNFGSVTQKPTLEPLNFDSSIDWAIHESNISKDSIYTVWIKDESIMKMDTLYFNMTFNKTDSLNNLITVTDSLRVVNRERKDLKKKKKKDEEEKVVLLDIQSNLKSSWDIYDNNIEIEFNEPLRDPLKSLISFQQKKDTIYYDADFKLEKDSLNPRKYRISRKWNFEEEFKIALDSATVYSIFGLWNGNWEQTFKIKSKDQYSNLAISVHGINDSIPSFMELLDSSGKPLRKARVIDHIALFRNINPGKYFARLILDTNGNNQWDTGDYKNKIQPEKVFYYPTELELKAFWEHQEDFNVDLSSLEKPEAILKNKPQDKSAREKLLQEQDSERYEQEKAKQQQEQDMLDPTGRNRGRRY